MDKNVMASNPRNRHADVPERHEYRCVVLD